MNLAVSGVCSALIALVFELEKLVEFMSIGTLLAYTIVSASVIILRYRPEPREGKHQDGDDISVSTTSTQSDISMSEVPTGGRLKPQFWWVGNMVGGCGPSSAISGTVLFFTCVSAALCFQLHYSNQDIKDGQWWAILTLIFLILCLVGCVLTIWAHEQVESKGSFRVPWVPVVPCLSILSNVGLMIHLHALTWVRFMVWMTLGLLVYFLYGIRHSKEGEQLSSYSMLMGTSEANKEQWGAVGGRSDVPPGIPGPESSEGSGNTTGKKKHRNITDEDKTALIVEEEEGE